ncbi:ISAs1 family transposase [Mesorhizobium sp.]|uniref:ISAs1 family transposase n=1 Tax=Mesorhizobium sp. TaxID=1871066 RepID=UPI00257B72B5|nr:ISAs1 family transposase [Mesorhizobium sp.]
MLALKANRLLLHAEVERFFAKPPGDMLDHPTRRPTPTMAASKSAANSLCHDVDWLFSDRRYTDEPRFPHLAMIGMVESKVERHGKTERGRRYYLSSAKLGPKSFAQAVPAHWGIENRLHWVLDVVFHDDLARLRTDNSPHNMALVRHIAKNLVRNPKDKHSLQVRRKLANLDPD